MNRAKVTICTEDEDESLKLAFRLGEVLSPGIYLLKGQMGAGKTAFVKAFTRGAGSDATTSSPTYAIVQEYETDRGMVYHFDLYRLEDPDELYAIGFDDYLEEKDAFLMIEWPELAGELEEEVVEIEIEPLENGRRFTFAGPEDVIQTIQTAAEVSV